MIGVSLGSQILAGIDETGCDWRTFAVDGWSGSPASTLAPVQKLQAPGAWLSPRQLTPRSLAPAGKIVAPTVDALRDAIDRLNAAASLDASTLSVTEGSLTRSCTVYRQGEPLVTYDTDLIATWSLALVAVDPRKYGEQIVASTGLPSTSGGLTWPLTWPIGWNSINASGVVSIDNPGNINGGLVVRIDGPCTSPAIRHDGLGVELSFATGYDLAAGSWLTIDMERRTILEGDTASRNGFITSRGWFQFTPGRNDIVFTSSAYNSSARMTVTTAPAYL